MSNRNYLFALYLIVSAARQLTLGGRFGVLYNVGHVGSQLSAINGTLGKSALRRPFGVVSRGRVVRWRYRSLGAFTEFFGLTIRVTKNNVFMVVYSLDGKVGFWVTKGRPGSDFELYTRIGVSLIRAMLDKVLALLSESLIGSTVYCLTLRGSAPIKRIITDLRAKRFYVRTIRASNALPHNGCRLPKRRRGARN